MDKLTPPAVAFVRCFDPNTSRMLNLWIELTTQEQIDNTPRGTELTVLGKTVQQVIATIRGTEPWMGSETIAEIVKASERLIPAHSSFYGTYDEYKATNA